MTGAIIAIAAAVFVIIAVSAELISGLNFEYYRYRVQKAREAHRSKKRARKHREEPIYERIAKAYEWKAELHLQEGRIEQARDEFRKAEETRREAMEAMMNGQEPKL